MDDETDTMKIMDLSYDNRRPIVQPQNHSNLVMNDTISRAINFESESSFNFSQVKAMKERMVKNSVISSQLQNRLIESNKLHYDKGMH